LGFEFYLGKGVKKKITKLYNIFLKFKYILITGGLGRVKWICESYNQNPT